MLEIRGRLERLVGVWLNRIEQARKAREPFRSTADICRNFYQGTCGFMWDDTFRNKFFSNLPAPQFKMTIAKAYEYVAIYGPSLFWDCPGITARPYARLEIMPEALGDPADPMTAQRYQQFMASYEQNRNRNKTRCSLMEQYLSYAQREQPNGGLAAESQLAIVEALITGRGCLWTENYQFPGSDRVLTRSVFDSCLRLFIDAQCTKPNLSDCGWIARQHVENYWDVERRFNLPTGSLARYSRNVGISGAEVNEVSQSGKDEYHPMKLNGNSTSNKIIWYEIFSKVGVGTRLEDFDSSIHEAFESTVGDFAYLAVAKGIPFPLNFPPSTAEQSDDEIRRALDWPVPVYRDGRWPVSLLDFYEAASGPWPLAPIGMGLGELIFLNVIMSCLADRVYMNSRNIWAVLKEAGDDIISKIKSNEFNIVLELNGMVHNNIQELVSMIQTPALNSDVIKIIEFISDSFDKRTGLVDIMYGMSSKVARTAADVNFKESTTSLRPDWMSRKVEAWQTHRANVERIYAGWNVRGQDLIPLFGPEGAQLWDELIAMEDPEVYVREMSMTVEANSIKKPNKFRDNENLTRIAQYLLPSLNEIAAMGNPTPLNAFIKSLGDAMEQDVTDWLIPPMAPPPPPEAPVDPAQQQPEQEPEQQPPMEQGGDIPPDVMALLNGTPPEAMMESASGIPM